MTRRNHAITPAHATASVAHTSACRGDTRVDVPAGVLVASPTSTRSRRSTLERAPQLLLLTIFSLGALHAQPVFTGADIFPPDEFAARRARVLAKIGDGVAIIQGTTERPGEQPLRQANQFFYISGVVEPRAILLIDGKTKRSTLFLNPRNDRREKMMFGPGLYPGDEAVKVTGIESVLPRDDFKSALDAIAKEGRSIYTPFRPEVLGCASASDPAALARATKNDPWDGRESREEAFRGHLKYVAAQSEIKDLDPILDELRGTKSPREIAVLREATRITGLAIIEAMRDARPGMKEYELQADAEFVFKKYGAYGPAYFALIATGENTWYSHYHRDTRALDAGDLVQFDYAPDYKYYSSDVTRVFPANGKFTPRQREFYTIYLKLYQAVMTSIEVHKLPADIARNAVVKMDAIMAAFPFTDEKIKKAAADFVDRYRRGPNSLGHNVGMEVHDVRNPTRTLEPGQVFTIEPAMQIADEHVGIRLEDMILITETGYENLSSFVPVEIADIEKMMIRHGLSDAQAKTK
jgi:Xaa-Pro aminopeptidase